MAEVLVLPRLYTEPEAAEKLNLTPFTLARERKAGKVSYRKVRRGVRYTDADLQAYVDSILVESCQDTRESPTASKSPATGSASDRTASPGAAPGSIVKLDRLAAHRLAQSILKPRS